MGKGAGLCSVRGRDMDAKRVGLQRGERAGLQIGVEFGVEEREELLQICGVGWGGLHSIRGWGTDTKRVGLQGGRDLSTAAGNGV